MHKHNLGVVGPADVKKLCSQTGMDEQAYIEKIKQLATKIAERGYEIILTPDKNSSVETFAKAYREHPGTKITGIFPKEDKDFGFGWLNSEICDVIENCGTWTEQESYVVKRSQNLLCLGFSRGVIIEICKTGMFWKNRTDSKIFVIRDFIAEKLPHYIAEGLPIVYVKLEAFLKTL